MSTILLIDSCSDLPLTYVEENKNIIDIIGMPIEIDDDEFIDDFGKSYSHKDYFNKLRDGKMPSTGLINIYRFTKKFTEQYKKGNSVIYLGFSANLSGTFNNALLAKEEVKSEFPEADIEIIDTAAASIGEGVLVVQAIEMLKDGKSKEDIIKWVETNKYKANHWFAVDDLHFLKNGGRVSSTSATVGTLLNVKPILTVDKKGVLKSYSNVRGRKKAIKFLVGKFEEHVIDCEKTTLIIGHGDCEEDALKIKEMITKEFNLKNIIVSQLSATIASHVGPNMIALAFLGQERES
ncbi:DegV family protein [Clostridium sediminicola]|uniref:DegV family protein n=1 Tax=Clostridium sediminicola TaxID=3114879 RepID=UPI0031F2004A